jgi:hypothetical protein
MFQGGRGDLGYDADNDVSIGSGGRRYHGPVVRRGVVHGQIVLLLEQGQVSLLHINMFHVCSNASFS